MKNILSDILETKKEEVKQLRKEFTFTRFTNFDFFNTRRIKFTEKLGSGNEIGIIAEVKKASPSKGIIRENFNHLKIADIFMNGGAAAISVLTDKYFFQGDIKYLSDIATVKSCPLLRKDFIIDEYQIFEAKAHGADIILLIAEALSKNQIMELSHAARENDLEVLLELHDGGQLTKIDFNINKLIGVNNRNLDDFSVDLNSTIELSKQIPEDVVLVSESGIHSKNDIDLLRNSGVQAVLIGEYFMKQKDINNSFRQMREWCSNES
ncbi:MAG: indole-3-glycerol phosphate synthase TrpC [Melioribacteraceae bacterium]|nr:indole-3-glycerol phosphate synthase TrpC [Melioribacteraceae bacterium]